MEVCTKCFLLGCGGMVHVDAVLCLSRFLTCKLQAMRSQLCQLLVQAPRRRGITFTAHTILSLRGQLVGVIVRRSPLAGRAIRPENPSSRAVHCERCRLRSHLSVDALRAPCRVQSGDLLDTVQWTQHTSRAFPCHHANSF